MLGHAERGAPNGIVVVHVARRRPWCEDEAEAGAVGTAGMGRAGAPHLDDALLESLHPTTRGERDIGHLDHGGGGSGRFRR
jgi:hypothetical protein